MKTEDLILVEQLAIIYLRLKIHNYKRTLELFYPSNALRRGSIPNQSLK